MILEAKMTCCCLTLLMPQDGLPLATGRGLRPVIGWGLAQGHPGIFILLCLTLCSIADMVPLPAEWAHVWTHADVAAEGVCPHH